MPFTSHRTLFRKTPLACAVVSALGLSAMAVPALAQEVIVYPGYSLTSDSLKPLLGAVGNRVTMNGGDVPVFVYGGNSSAGAADGNTVTLNSGNVGTGNIGGEIDGGFGVTASGNSVFVTGGTVINFEYLPGLLSNGHVIGGNATFDATGNSVTISGGSVMGSVRGGLSDFGNATGNAVTISGGLVGGDVDGGLSYNGNATGNTVTINNGSVVGEVDGGYSDNSATGNTVTMSGGSVGDGIAGGNGGDGGATGNIVIIAGGTVNGGVDGGYAYNNATNGTATATGNTVTISGGTVNGDIHGGAIRNSEASAATANGVATGNTVTLEGAPTLNGTLYGGLIYNSGAVVDVRTGNTLNVKNTGITAFGIQNFANYNFYLPTAMTAGQTMLTVTQGNGAGGAADISNSVIGVGINGSTSALHAGDRVTLIHSGTGLTATGINTRAVGLQGIARIYDFDLTTDVDNLYATAVGGPSLNPQLKALSEGHLAGLALAGQGADLILGAGLSNALAATRRQDAGLVAFAAVNGGNNRYKTGSHIDVDGYSLLTGFAWRTPLAAGRSLLAGAFFEAGSGNYHSFNSFASAPSVRGNGDTHYYGGGALARYEAPFGKGGLYADASLRAGRVTTKFSSGDILNSQGNAHFDTGSAYYGAHAGLGYVWSLTEKLSLDLSSKYVWTHQDGNTVTLSGDNIRFEDADSQRWRSGARLAYAFDDTVSLYGGAYYDHEFDGKAHATANGEAFDTPKLAGGTGVAELGVTVRPLRTSAAGFSFDFGIQGYSGVRQGVTGSAQMKYEF